MSDRNYFVRQKTLQIPDSSFKLVKLYAIKPDRSAIEIERLQEPEQYEINLTEWLGRHDLSAPNERELLEVVYDSTFDENDYVLSFTFPSSMDDETREKELSSYLTRLSWVYQGTPTYVCLSGRDAEGGLCFTVILRSDGQLTDKALMKVCGRSYTLNIEHNKMSALPTSEYWRCSNNIQPPVLTVEDGAISPDDLEAFLKAKVGEDTTPVIHKMFGEWEMVHSRFTSFEYGEPDNSHIELKLVKQDTFDI